MTEPHEVEIWEADPFGGSCCGIGARRMTAVEAKRFIAEVKDRRARETPVSRRSYPVLKLFNFPSKAASFTLLAPNCISSRLKPIANPSSCR